MPLTAGSHLGHYEILKPIGKGGMGEVYRARDTKLGRDVAIKVLPEEFSRDKERLDRFEREARLLAQLNHPNIATLHGLKESGGQRFLIMELLEGETLAERIVRGPIPIDEATRVTIRMFETDLDTHLREIQRKLKEHRFEPQPVLRVYIPKPADPKKRRPLGIPVVTDRIVQQAIVQAVEPLFDAQMSTRSYGYRKVARRTMPSPLLSRMRKRDSVSS